MADFESIIKQHATGEGGSIPADALGRLAESIKGEVGKGFVDKKRYNDKLAEIETLKTEKQTAEDNAAQAAGWKDKYDTLNSQFETYKTEQQAKDAHNVKEKAYTELLKAAGVPEKRLGAILKVTDLDALEMDGDALKDADKLTDTIKTEWADFIPTVTTAGPTTPTPPTTGGGEEKDPFEAGFDEG